MINFFSLCIVISESLHSKGSVYTHEEFNYHSFFCEQATCKYLVANVIIPLLKFIRIYILGLQVLY
jgi:hypothetical protein